MRPRFLSDRQPAWIFFVGCLAVTAGVLLHLPMYWMGHASGFRLAGMAMDADMLFGMVLIVAGIGVAAYGLLPRDLSGQRVAARRVSVHAPEMRRSARRIGS